MARASFRIKGMLRLKMDLKKLGMVPQKHVTSAARKGMNISLKQSKATATYLTGDLQKGLILKGERSKLKAKKVYQVIFDPKMNDVFQKKNAEGKITGYYPISQEYGYFSKSGNYIPGYRFVHDSLTDNVRNIERKIVEDMSKKINKEISKLGLK